MHRARDAQALRIRIDAQIGRDEYPRIAVIDDLKRVAANLEVRLERRPVQYSYTDGQLYYFMDASTFEMIPIAADVIGEDQLLYLKENMGCEGLVHDDTVIAVELPQFVELEVTTTDPGVRGDTAQGGTKPATLETGAVIQVPLFVDIGDVVKVDRTEDKYLTRVSG